ncbi:MAG: hypothetical protein DMF90_16245, partial [Acidobacteria bacterium]
HCLEVRGLVRSAWGVSDNNRRAKFYTPTAAGRRELARETESWTRVATAIGRVMQTAQGRSMRPLQAFGRRLLALFRRQRLEQDLEDELAFHLAMRAADHRDAGLPPDSAGAAARRQFGSVTLLKEQARAVWTFPSVDTVLQDIRFALRMLRRSAGFAVATIGTLALGLGSSTAIFSVVNAIVLRPLPFSEPEHLVMIRPSSGARVSAAFLDGWRRESRTFQDFAGWHEGRANLTGGSEPLAVSVDHTTTNFFAVLGTPALVGRTFTADADLSRVEPGAVLSYALWQRRYGGDPQIIGRSIILDTQPLTIVGVMPARFAIRTNELAESRADLWIPLPLDRTSDAGILTVVARVTSGIALTQAQAELSLMTQHLERGTPYYALHWTWGAVPLLKATVQDVRLTLLVLFGSVSILLMLVCANVATLLLSRGISRQPEFAVRLSLGATPGRLRRQLLSESAAVAALAGVLGILVAYWGTRTVLLIVPPGLDLPRTKEIGMDLRVFGFATVVTTMTAVVFGLVPSVTTTGFGPSSLHQAARGSSASRTQVRFGSGLIVTEVALALVLLVGAGLLVRSFSMLLRVSPGFQTDHVLTMRTTLPASEYDTDDRRRAFSQELLTRLARLPGMAHVGLTNYLPLTRFGIAYRFEIAGHAEARVEDQKFAWVSVVGGHYFEAMGIPLLRGRLPGETDSQQTRPVFVIDESLARRYWSNEEDPLGAEVVWHRTNEKTLTGVVIGIVGSVRGQSLTAEPPAAAYWWWPQIPGLQRHGRRADNCATEDHGRTHGVADHGSRPEPGSRRCAIHAGCRRRRTGPPSFYDAAAWRVRGHGRAPGGDRVV